MPQGVFFLLLANFAELQLLSENPRDVAEDNAELQLLSENPRDVAEDNAAPRAAQSSMFMLCSRTYLSMVSVTGFFDLGFSTHSPARFLCVNWFSSFAASRARCWSCND